MLVSSHYGTQYVLSFSCSLDDCDKDTGIHLFARNHHGVPQTENDFGFGTAYGRATGLATAASIDIR